MRQDQAEDRYRKHQHDIDVITILDVMERLERPVQRKEEPARGSYGKTVPPVPAR